MPKLKYKNKTIFSQISNVLVHKWNDRDNAAKTAPKSNTVSRLRDRAARD